MKYFKDALDEMIPFQHKRQLVVLESTTYPGTIEDLIKPRLEER